jgi:hypothetical protein
VNRLRLGLHRLYQYPLTIYRFSRIVDRRYARSMKKFRLATIAFVLIGTLNLLAFVYVATHREYAPATYSQDYFSSSNIPVPVPAWIGHMH